LIELFSKKFIGEKMNKENIETKETEKKEMKRVGRKEVKENAEERKQIKLAKIIVPDTCTIIDGRLTELISSGEIKEQKILIHKAVIGELEHQANSGKEVGWSGLAEIRELRALAEEKKLEIEYTGERSTELMIKAAKLGEIDASIRALAKTHKALLLTSDKVQSEVARAEGIDVVYFEPRESTKELSFKKFLTPDTVSLHFKENIIPLAKKGKPGEVKLVKVSEERSTRDELEDMAKEIMETARRDDKSYIEMDSKGASVIQLREFRTVIARTPFSDGIEITIVRPIIKANLQQYALSEKLRHRLQTGAEGIIICGSPGCGKSTFAAALAEEYLKQDKIVKTLESPRDLQVPDEITQYAPLDGSFEKTSDILLLVRPDYSIYDEMRKTSDFKVFSDMRLAGIGMLGVVHSTRPIEAIQRFFGRIDLGMIPQVVDTVIFIKAGRIQKVLELRLTVKIPVGMRDRDLARPVILVSDFETGQSEWEIYKFGDETVCMPSRQEQKGGRPENQPDQNRNERGYDRHDHGKRRR